jgi:drug/metabolite transporter (DMT)-like permease
MTRQRIRAYIFICTTVFLWGISFFWTNRLLEYHVPVFFLIFTRISLAALILFVFGKITGVIQRIKNKKDVLWFMGLALMEPFFYFTGEAYGVKLTASPNLSSVIVSSIPIFGLIAGITFYREKVTLRNIVGIILTLPGLMMVVLGKWGLELGTPAGLPGTNMTAGIMFLFMAVFSAVGHTVILKRITMSYNAYTITFYQHVLGAVYFLVPVLFFDLKRTNVSLFLTDWNFWYPIIMLSVLCSSVAFLLFTTAIKELGVTRTNTFAAIIPIVTAAAGFMLGIETLNWIQITGILIVVTGVILSQLRSRRN